MKYILIALVCTVVSYAQVTTKHIDGLRDKPAKLIAITNVTLIPEPGKKVENATVLIQDNKIIATGVVNIPAGTTIKDGKGLWCYAAFIEPYTNVGIAPPKKPEQPIGFDDGEDSPETPVVNQAKHWNLAVKPQDRAIEALQLDDKTAEEYRKLGFGALQTNSMDGIFRGSSVVVLAKGGTAHQIALFEDATQWVSFRKGTSKTPYPSAMMGSIALIKQTLSDADWYDKAHAAYKVNPTLKKPEFNVGYEALATSLKAKKTFICETENEHSILRWQKIAQEFGLNVVYEGSGYEYRRLKSLVPFKPTLILPVNFPAVPDVSTPDRALDVSFDELRHWDAAPENPMLCDSAGLRFCFTTHGLKSKEDYFKNIRKAVKRGLKEDVALAAMTTIPASVVGAQQVLGMVRTGFQANFILTTGNLFEDETVIRSVYVAGDEYVMSKPAEYDVRGKWTLMPESGQGLPMMSMNIDGKPESPGVTVKKDSTTLTSSIGVSGSRVTLKIQTDTLGHAGFVRLIGSVAAKGDQLNLIGTLTLNNGKEILFSATRDSLFVEKPQTKDKKEIATKSLPTTYPNTAFGLDSIPVTKTVLIKNATVWTCGKQGILKETDVLLKNGKIAEVGKNLSGAEVTVDGTGKHVTPGIIDEHSHIAIESGVNEGTHAITAEVRIGDVLFPDDINIYRQLSGGVTSSHLLHGSANPIGGQLQLIKLRWGDDADGLKFREAAGTIKFALGENVKQSNWGDRFSVRYPQTRMGVEEIMRDGFRAALEYEKQKQNAGKDALPLRKDYQLETLSEIIRGKRFIHCHSYVQSEILMLMKLADEFNFQVKTFTHILEGYKVAREMKEHGTTASSFADWWAYKMEVADAIPQNPAILHEQGVVTSVNSDDAEMARRLNQESAKSVKYGGVNQEEALKMCTINPAIQLGVDDLVGSIEVGKQADIVLWSGNPLSNFSRVLQTYVDGKKYFDVEADAKLRERDRLVRAQLEQRALKAISGGDEKATGGGKRPRREYDCGDVEDEMKGSEE